MKKLTNFTAVEDRLQYNILYSCTGEAKRGHEPFVAEHALTYITHGEIHLHTDKGVLVAPKGTIGLLRRHQLVKAVKKPGVDGPFMSINIFLDQQALRRYSAAHDVHATGIYTGDPIVALPVDPFMKGYFDSLMPYFEHPEQLTETLASLKTTEAIALLLRNPSLKNLLFDFSEPFKIDLEAYMNRHFTYNVPLEQFARLTGRSLSTFKRDFAKTFRTPPERWLQKRRLEQAHYLITQRHQRPSEVYLEVGFENFSHFSTAFKKEFGQNASEVR
ncbi:helix-turn-helix domain-containing protein [Parapedobacter koreensis]|uniref:AraC-type DNA-binding protein n=1 Tax=Parapedobacter koreensis TaxID=332977 RepID=A0A1H7LMX4_9SPHI|nr:AraC family transcriptional regulator [Parapedobacter koreensis]SEL00199.1 AraC-type DNA-binding protein [Parapedobacter koreensis]